MKKAATIEIKTISKHDAHPYSNNTATNKINSTTSNNAAPTDTATTNNNNNNTTTTTNTTTTRTTTTNNNNYTYNRSKEYTSELYSSIVIF